MISNIMKKAVKYIIIFVIICLLIITSIIILKNSTTEKHNEDVLSSVPVNYEHWLYNSSGNDLTDYYGHSDEIMHAYTYEYNP